MNSPDLLSLILTLTPHAPPPPEKEIPQWWGRAAHRLLLTSLGKVDTALADASHEESELRPFTTSTLRGRFPEGKLDLAGMYELRLTALNTAVAKGLLEAAAMKDNLAAGSIVELDGILFRISGAAVNAPEHPDAQQSTYQDLSTQHLLAAQPAPQSIKLVFLSGTNFGANGRLGTNGRNFPYPLPELVFGNLLERWNAFAPMAFPDELRQYATQCLHISSFQLSSRKAVVAGGMQVGSVGHVAFRSHNYDRYWMSLIWTLAHYAFYAGVGAKTTMGMGQCRMVETEG